VSYIVIQSGSSDQAAYREFDDLGSAVAHLEEVCNGPAGADARLCSLDPVAYKVKQYFKIELPDDHIEAVASGITTVSSGAAEVVDTPVSDTATVFEPLAMVETSDLEPHGSSRDSHLTGESRRGLFGR